MTSEFIPERSDAIRSLLVSTAAEPHRPPRLLASFGLVAVGLVVGAAVSAAALSLSTPGPMSAQDTAAVPAPAGVIPGQPIISLLGSPVSQTITGDGEIALTPMPVGASHARVTITCLTAGTTSWGLDPDGNNPTVSCSAADLIGPSGTAYVDVALEPGATTLFIRADGRSSSVLTYQFINYVETEWGVNSRGETFGASTADAGDPDLVAVSAITPEGDAVLGYARRADLEAFGPEWPGQPRNPTEALAWQTDRDERYPQGWDIPAFASDGVTQLGVFHIG